MYCLSTRIFAVRSLAVFFNSQSGAITTERRDVNNPTEVSIVSWVSVSGPAADLCSSSKYYRSALRAPSRRSFSHLNVPFGTICISVWKSVVCSADINFVVGVEL